MATLVLRGQAGKLLGRTIFRQIELPSSELRRIACAGFTVTGASEAFATPVARNPRPYAASAALHR